MNNNLFVPVVAPIVEVPSRGAFLTGLLSLRFIRDLAGLFIGFITMQALSLPDFPMHGQERRAYGNLVTMLMIAACVDLAAVAGTLSWRKWGVFMLAGAEVFSLVVSLEMQTLGGWSSLLGLLTIIGAAFAIMTRWKHFA